MPRTPRRARHASEACCHVHIRGHNREAVFADDADRACFLQLLVRYRDRFHLHLCHSCLIHELDETVPRQA